MKRSSGILFLLALVGGRALADGQVHVDSFPAGALVYVDGAATNLVTPADLTLAEGAHDLAADGGTGWAVADAQLTVLAGSQSVTLTLLPLLTQGPAGPAGADGAPGAPGAAASVTPLAPGDASCPVGGALVTAGDGTSVPVCNGLAGPPGLPGPRGPVGATGATGPQGPAGPPGLAGPA